VSSNNLRLSQVIDRLTESNEYIKANFPAIRIENT